MSKNHHAGKTILTWTGHLVAGFFFLHSLLLLSTPSHDLMSLPAPNPVLTLGVSLLALVWACLASKKTPQNPVIKKALANLSLFLVILTLRLPLPGVSFGILLALLAVQALWIQDPGPSPWFKPAIWKRLQVAALALVLSALVMGFFRLGFSDTGSLTLPDTFLPQAFYRQAKDPLFLWVSLAVGLLATLILASKDQAWLDKKTPAITRTAFGLALFFGVFVLGIFLFLRVYLLRTPTFDFGLFAQMFENMRKGYGMVTTLERDRLLSHLAVHFSPIYYLMLPFYTCLPYPETLQILQVLVVASGLVPLRMICTDLGLSKRTSLVVASLFMAGPALVGSSFYDLHENCFLPPLVLWSFYACLRQRPLPMLVSVLLVLLVKEDAFIYPVAIGLYFIFSGLRRGLDQRLIRTYARIYLLLPVLTFISLVTLLNSQGTGAMTGRFRNLMAYDLGLVGVILTALQSPGLVIANLFKSAKIYYLLTLLLGLGFLPLRQKYAENFFLMVPLVVMNLLSDYPYQHHLEFQYSYGSFVLLICMTALSLAEYPQAFKVRQKYLPLLLTFATAFSLTNTAMRLHVKTHPLAVMALNESPIVRESKETLKALPRDQKLLVHKLYTTPLADVFDLYDLGDHHEGQVDPSIDYVVIPRHGPLFKAEEAILPAYLEAGFEEDPLYSTYAVLVLKNPQ